MMLRILCIFLIVSSTVYAQDTTAKRRTIKEDESFQPDRYFLELGFGGGSGGIGGQFGLYVHNQEYIGGVSVEGQTALFNQRGLTRYTFLVGKNSVASFASSDIMIGPSLVYINSEQYTSTSWENRAQTFGVTVQGRAMLRLFVVGCGLSASITGTPKQVLYSINFNVQIGNLFNYDK